MRSRTQAYNLGRKPDWFGIPVAGSMIESNSNTHRILSRWTRPFEEASKSPRVCRTSLYRIAPINHSVSCGACPELDQVASSAHCRRITMGVRISECRKGRYPIGYFSANTQYRRTAQRYTSIIEERKWRKLPQLAISILLEHLPFGM